MMVRAHTLTADPSYERYLGEDESSSVKDGDRILVPLQEIGTQYRQNWVQACIEKAGHWVVIARKEDISMEQVRVVVTGPFINFLLHNHNVNINIIIFFFRRSKRQRNFSLFYFASQES